MSSQFFQHIRNRTLSRSNGAGQADSIHVCLLVLTVRTIVGAPAALLYVFNKGSARFARRSLTAVNSQIFLIFPFPTATVDKISNRRTAVFNAFSQDGMNGLCQSLRSLLTDVIAATRRANAGKKESFIYVNISQSGQTV